MSWVDQQKRPGHSWPGQDSGQSLQWLVRDVAVPACWQVSTAMNTQEQQVNDWLQQLLSRTEDVVVHRCASAHRPHTLHEEALHTTASPATLDLTDTAATQVCIQFPTSADNMAFSAERCATVNHAAAGPSGHRDRSISLGPGPQQQWHAAVWWKTQQMDVQQLHRPCSAYYVGTANKV